MPEDGFTKLPHTLFDALIRNRIPGQERQVLDLIIRKTIGFNKASDRIALGQFCGATGMKKSNVSRALKSLCKQNIVIKNDNGATPKYRLNGVLEDWRPLSKTMQASKAIKGCIGSDNEGSSEAMHTKELLQKNSSKETAEVILEHHKRFKKWLIEHEARVAGIAQELRNDPSYSPKTRAWVRREVAKATAWLIANPGRANKKQWGRFLNNWLANHADDPEPQATGRAHPTNVPS